MSDHTQGYQSTPSDTLEQRIMDPRIAKSEAEWWAAREIERLRAWVKKYEAPEHEEYQDLTRLRARVAELEAAQAWRPIESAPKTPQGATRAVEILGWCPDVTAPTGGDRRTIWWEPRLRGGSWCSDRDLVEYPTLWADLPPQPKGDA